MTGIITPDDVVQFRAVPYATHPARFKQSVLLDNINGTSRDFTQHGYLSLELAVFISTLLTAQQPRMPTDLPQP